MTNPAAFEVLRGLQLGRPGPVPRTPPPSMIDRRAPDSQPHRKQHSGGGGGGHPRSLPSDIQQRPLTPEEEAVALYGPDDRDAGAKTPSMMSAVPPSTVEFVTHTPVANVGAAVPTEGASDTPVPVATAAPSEAHPMGSEGHAHPSEEQPARAAPEAAAGPPVQQSVVAGLEEEHEVTQEEEAEAGRSLPRRPRDEHGRKKGGE